MCVVAGVTKGAATWMSSIRSVRTVGTRIFLSSPPTGSLTDDRVGQLLHIAYAYVQMLLYEPLLGWVPQNGRDSMDPEVLQYLIRYISVARNIVSTGMSIHKAKVANFSSRSTMISTTYSAIMSLIVFLLNMPAPSGTKGAVLEEAFEGKGLLERLAPKSRLANEYLQKLKEGVLGGRERPQEIC